MVFNGKPGKPGKPGLPKFVHSMRPLFHQTTFLRHVPASIPVAIIVSSLVQGTLAELSAAAALCVRVAAVMLFEGA